MKVYIVLPPPQEFYGLTAEKVCGSSKLNACQLMLARWRLCSPQSTCEILSKNKPGYKTYNEFKATLRCTARPKVINIKMLWGIKTYIIQGASFIIIILCNVSTTSASLLINISLHYYDMYYKTYR